MGTVDNGDLRLLETMLWTPEQGVYLRERHLERMGRSAAALGLPWAQDAVEAALEAALAGLDRTARQRVRLLVDRAGRVAVESAVLPAAAPDRVVRVGIASAPVASNDLLLRHKTTRREVYDAARAGRPDCDDVLLYNERGELTESTIANVVVARGNEMLTPASACGLLPGTFRAELLAAGEIHETVIPVASLPTAASIWLINSVRLWMPAALVGGLAQLCGDG